ncbi:Fc.00g001910.m01.CDS01 [Cosmosporella sp. VM-42]
MPPPSSAQQKVLIAQFVSLTGASERSASRFLKSASFKINEAVDSRPRDLGPGLGLAGTMGWKGVKNHISSRVIPAWSISRKPSKNNLESSSKEPLKEPKPRYSISAVHQRVLIHGRVGLVTFKCGLHILIYFASAGDNKGPSPLETKLDGLFDSLRDEGDGKDKLELDSTMAYLSKKLKISLENAELFVVMELVQAPNVGEITRKGFVDGWKVSGVGATHQEHATHIRSLVSSLSEDHTLFKKVYKYTFIAGKEGDQKALSLENAQIYWSMLFSRPGMVWKTANHDWLELWRNFLAEKWTRSVNKDMWNMTLEFALKTLSDESLSFWNEDGAWPSVIDDFVDWCRQKGIGKIENMDVDQ